VRKRAIAPFVFLAFALEKVLQPAPTASAGLVWDVQLQGVLLNEQPQFSQQREEEKYLDIPPAVFSYQFPAQINGLQRARCQGQVGGERRAREGTSSLLALDARAIIVGLRLKGSKHVECR
jgi:hypothetical protein